jgi:phosphoserine phosphatase
MPSFYHITSVQKTIPEEVLEAINSLPVVGKPYAAFDLDNTLLIGDIGEAVFALLVKKKLIKDFGWKDYQALIKKNKLKAYKHIINLMQGLHLRELEKVTVEVIKSKNSTIIIDGDRIPVPKPNKQMQSILELLKKKGIAIYIVTASNEVSAQIICRKYFNIPETNIIGAEVARNKKGIIKLGDKEFPYAKGKVNILKKKFKNKPLVTGGDSPGDIYLLRHTAKAGISFWLGKAEIDFI